MHPVPLCVCMYIHTYNNISVASELGASPLISPLCCCFMSSGCFRMHLRKHAEALEDFNMAAKLCSSSPVIFYNRALCHQGLGSKALVSALGLACSAVVTV